MRLIQFWPIITPLYTITIKKPLRVGIYWLKRYLEKLLYIKIKAKPIKTARKKAQDPTYILSWFTNLLAYYKEHGITLDDF